MRRSADPKVNNILKACRKAGWKIVPCTNGFKLLSPDGTSIVTVHNSVSDVNAYRNMTSRLRRAGLNIREY